MYHRMMFIMATNGDVTLVDRDFDSHYQLIVDMTSRFRSLNLDIKMKNAQSFLGDMFHLLHFLARLHRLCFEAHRFGIDTLKPENIDKFMHSIRELAVVTCDIRNRYIRRWSLRNDITVTPTFIYLNEYSHFFKGRSVTIDKLLNWGLSITEILSTLRQNRDIIIIRTSTNHCSITLVDLNDDLDYILAFDLDRASVSILDHQPDEGRDARREWRNQQTLFVYEDLKKKMNNCDISPDR